jgi:hypothetical protein
MKWLVTYTHDRAAGLTWTFEVEASDDTHAAMQAGMARAESFDGRFMRDFYRPHRLNWERLSTERKDDVETAIAA